jgi:hypothetical protein
MLYKFDGYIFTNEFDPAFPGYKKKGKYVPLHIYVYWLNTGLVPENNKTCIHHIDGDKFNNEFDNLMLMSLKNHAKIHYIPTKQTKNLRSKISYNNGANKIFGFRGVEYTGKNWRSRIQYNKKRRTLGSFPDPLSGQIVYNFVQIEIYGE